MELKEYKDKLYEIDKLLEGIDYKIFDIWDFRDIRYLKYKKSLAELEHLLIKRLFKNISNVAEDELEDFINALHNLSCGAKKNIKEAEEDLEEKEEKEKKEKEEDE